MVVLWDHEAPKDGRLMAKVGHSVYALEVDRERNLLVIGHNFEGIHVIDIENQKELWSLNLTNQAIFDIKILGEEILIGTADGVITVVDILSKSVKRHIKLSEKSVRVMAISPDQKTLAVGLSDHSIKIFDLDSFQPVQQLQRHTNSVFALGFSPDGKYLISGARDAHLQIWDGQTFEHQQAIVAHMFAINYLGFRKDGQYFVTCSMDKSVKVWDANSFKLLKVIDKSRHAGHGTSINKVLWSKYNDHIVSVSDDRTISIWNIEL